MGIATTGMRNACAMTFAVVAIPTLDLVAYPLRHTSRLIVAVLDARRKEVFHAGYHAVPGGVQRAWDYTVATPAELVAELETFTGGILLAGDGVARFRDEFASLEHAERAGAEHSTPSVAALVELGTARMEREEFEQPWDVHPLYLRQSDAEIEWDRRGL